MSLYGSLLATDLISGVKRRGSIPDAQNTLDDNDILDFLNEELMDSVVPQVLQFHEEYFGYIKKVDLEPNTNHYKIPYRAIGRKLRDLKYSDKPITNTDTGVVENLYNMTRILPEDRSYFQGSSFNPYKAFYFQGDEVVLTPDIGTIPVGALVFSFFMRPNKIVKENRCAKILGFNATTGVLTLDSIPVNIQTGLLDIVEAQPGHRLLKYDVSSLNINPLALTITINPDNVPDSLAVGDYLCSQGESPVAQIPAELQSLLTERGAARCLAALGHTENLQMSNQKIQELEQKSGSLIDNRSEGQPIKVNNLGGLLRQSKVSRRRFYF